MHSDAEELSLNPSEREMAREHWDAMMFAPSRTALESARLALMDAPFPIQQAVIANINANWLEEYEPEREENPFLASAFSHDLAPVKENKDDIDSSNNLLASDETFPTDAFVSAYAVPSYSLSSSSQSFPSLSTCAQRVMQGISHLSTIKLGGRMTSHNSSFQSASTHH